MGNEQRLITNAWTSEGRPVQDAPRPVSGAGRVVTDVGLLWEPDQCQGLTRAGEACTSPPIKGTPWCNGHTKQQEKLKDG